jgi:hypothetical protein
MDRVFRFDSLQIIDDKRDVANRSSKKRGIAGWLLGIVMVQGSAISRHETEILGADRNRLALYNNRNCFCSALTRFPLKRTTRRREIPAGW